MEYQRGIFGVLNADAMEEEPLLLLDGGIERRKNQKYDFYNGERGGFGGYLFQYTLKGEGRLYRRGKEYRVKREQGFMIPFPDESRYWLPQEPEAEWEFLYLHFSGAVAEPFVRRLREEPGDIFSVPAESIPIRMAVNLQERLCAGERLERYAGGEFLYRFLCALLRETEKPHRQAGSLLVRRAEECMSREFAQLQGVEEAAARLGVSPAHLSRCFKAEMGISPVQFLARQKIQAAMNELLGTEKTVEQIARENGFSCGNYFGKVFRRYVGMSPGEYRSRKMFI